MVRGDYCLCLVSDDVAFDCVVCIGVSGDPYVASLVQVGAMVDVWYVLAWLVVLFVALVAAEWVSTK